jgi:enoyl-CoA hydratase
VRHARTGAGGHVLLVTLDNPRRANAYTTPLLLQLRSLLADARGDRSIAAAVVTGSAGYFCAGADLGELAARDAEDAFALLSREVFDLLADAPWPTIAAIDGAAVAGGFELALACDLRVCSARSVFRLPEVELGLVPAAGGVRRLAGEVGLARAREVILFGRTLDAATALQWGLVAHVVDDPLSHAVGLAEAAGKRDPVCLTVAKLLLQESAGASPGRGTEAIAQALLYGRRHRSRDA